jgi:hypothetical protein
MILTDDPLRDNYLANAQKNRICSYVSEFPVNFKFGSNFGGNSLSRGE